MTPDRLSPVKMKGAPQDIVVDGVDDLVETRGASYTRRRCETTRGTSRPNQGTLFNGRHLGVAQGLHPVDTALEPTVYCASELGLGECRKLLKPTQREALVPWWFERGGPTRSHPEHGSETPQR